jgi:hypothetical protein
MIDSLARRQASPTAFHWLQAHATEFASSNGAPGPKSTGTKISATGIAEKMR